MYKVRLSNKRKNLSMYWRQSQKEEIIQSDEIIISCCPSFDLTLIIHQHNDNTAARWFRGLCWLYTPCKLNGVFDVIFLFLMRCRNRFRNITPVFDAPVLDQLVITRTWFCVCGLSSISNGLHRKFEFHIIQVSLLCFLIYI